MIQLQLDFDQDLIDDDELSPEEKERRRILAEIKAEQENPLTPPTIYKYRDQLVFPAADQQPDDDEE